MKNKTMLRFLLCFLIISICSASLFSYAALDVNNFFTAGQTQFNNVISKIESNETMGPVLHIQSLIMMAGTLVAIIVVIIYGVQWVTATSSKRQELKSGLYPLCIGVILLVIGPTMAIKIYDEMIKYDSNNIEGYVNGVGGTIVNVVQIIGYLVAVGMILIVGIQWATSTANKRQELKSRMINIIIGAILIAGGVTILDWVANIASTDMNVLYDAPEKTEKTDGYKSGASGPTTSVNSGLKNQVTQMQQK